MEDCIFCKIIRGEIPCYKIYEDEDVLAFLDIAKDCYGHTLVVPKKHFKNTLDCDEAILHKVISAVKKISNHYIEDCGFKGITILNANNVEGGQTVFHLHYHIVPKLTKEDSAFNFVENSETTPLETQQEKLKMF